MFTDPYAAESSATISPRAATASCARWKLRHGMSRVQGSTSFP